MKDFCMNDNTFVRVHEFIESCVVRASLKPSWNRVIEEPIVERVGDLGPLLVAFSEWIAVVLRIQDFLDESMSDDVTEVHRIFKVN